MMLKLLSEVKNKRKHFFSKIPPVACDGFTLIEILLVIGIVLVLAITVFVSIDPVQRFQEARDVRRNTDVYAISSALSQYALEHHGALPAGIDAAMRQIGTASSGCALHSHFCSIDADNCVNLTADVAPYMKSLPFDALSAGTDKTHYAITKNDHNRVTVIACDTEGDDRIEVSH